MSMTIVDIVDIDTLPFSGLAEWKNNRGDIYRTSKQLDTAHWQKMKRKLKEKQQRKEIKRKMIQVKKKSNKSHRH